MFIGFTGMLALEGDRVTVPPGHGLASHAGLDGTWDPGTP